MGLGLLEPSQREGGGGGQGRAGAPGPIRIPLVLAGHSDQSYPSEDHVGSTSLESPEGSAGGRRPPSVLFRAAAQRPLPAKDERAPAQGFPEAWGRTLRVGNLGGIKCIPLLQLTSH